jgi:PAS domain S-box-containing protein
LLSGKENTVISTNRNYTKSGEIIACIWHNSILMDKEGHMTSVMSLVQDITERRMSEKLLLQSREQYRMLVEMSPYAVFVNRNNKIVYVNPACVNLFGALKPQQIIGMSPFELFHHESHAIVEARIASLTKGNSVPLNEEKIVRFDGNVREVEVAASTFTDQDGQAIQVILHDITENKKSEAKLLRLNQTLIALDKCSQATVRLNDENSFLKEICQVIFNECHYKMVWIGYALDDSDKTVLPVVHFGLDKGYLQSMHISWADTERGHGPTGTAIRTGNTVTCNNMLTDPNFLPWREQALKRGYASSIALPLITAEKTIGALTIYSKQPDSFSGEQKELLTELANEVAYGITAIRWKIAQANAEKKLKKYAEDLKDLNDTKDKFFGIIAHDLKNPFTSILGASEILAANADEFDADTIKKFSLLLHDAGKNGYAMLENLLEWSRSQTGRLSFIPRPLNVKEVIRQNLDNLTLIANQKEITMQMSVPEDLFMVADLNMTHTILRNLLTNALKFTFRKGKVTISASSNEKDVIITITDNGIGISKEEQKKLFRVDVKYTRIGTAEERGTGLGLLLCREFIEKQYGKIWIKSAPGKGSSFIFTLPVKLPVHSSAVKTKSLSPRRS